MKKAKTYELTTGTIPEQYLNTHPEPRIINTLSTVLDTHQRLRMGNSIAPFTRRQTIPTERYRNLYHSKNPLHLRRNAFVNNSFVQYCERNKNSSKEQNQRRSRNFSRSRYDFHNNHVVRTRYNHYDDPTQNRAQWRAQNRPMVCRRTINRNINYLYQNPSKTTSLRQTGPRPGHSMAPTKYETPKPFQTNKSKFSHVD